VGTQRRVGRVRADPPDRRRGADPAPVLGCGGQRRRVDVDAHDPFRAAERGPERQHSGSGAEVDHGSVLDVAVQVGGVDHVGGHPRRGGVLFEVRPRVVEPRDDREPGFERGARRHQNHPPGAVDG